MEVVAIIGSILVFIILIIYLAFIFGAPCGEYIMGGQKKSLPKNKSWLYWVAILIQIIMILVLVQAGGLLDLSVPSGVIKVIGYIIAVYLSLNVVMNFFSKSKKERALMTPLSLIASICFWITIVNM